MPPNNIGRVLKVIRSPLTSTRRSCSTPSQFGNKLSSTWWMRSGQRHQPDLQLLQESADGFDLLFTSDQGCELRRHPTARRGFARGFGTSSKVSEGGPALALF